MIDGTQNFYPGDLQYMQEHPDERANEIGSCLPYHLQYIRDGKPVVKPEGKDAGFLQHQ